LKIMRFSIAFLLLVGCQSGNLEETPDLDDLEVLEKIVAQAMDVKKLQSKRRVLSKKAYLLPNLKSSLLKPRLNQMA